MFRKLFYHMGNLYADMEMIEEDLQQISNQIMMIWVCPM